MALHRPTSGLNDRWADGLIPRRPPFFTMIMTLSSRHADGAPACRDVGVMIIGRKARRAGRASGAGGWAGGATGSGGPRGSA
jgi:hypothetical protein